MMERFARFVEMFADFPALQKDLSLLDKPANGTTESMQTPALPLRTRLTIPSGAPPPYRPAPAQPQRSGTLPVNGHRPSGSGETRDRAPPRPRGADSPSKEQRRHPRRASESSIMNDKDRPRREDRDRGERPPRTESEERRRRERRKERDERHRREKEKIRSGGGKMKKSQGLDIIDKLDVTGIYGQGREYLLSFTKSLTDG